MKNVYCGLLLILFLTRCIGVDEVEPLQDNNYVINIEASQKAVLVGSSVDIIANAIKLGDTTILNDGSWKSSDESIALINNGRVTGVSQGNVFIWVEHEGITSDSLVINVVSSTSVLATINLSSPFIRMLHNQTAQLEAVGYNLSGEVVPVQNQIWLSDNEEVLFVSQEGLSTSRGITGQSTVQVSSGLISSNTIKLIVLDAKDTVKKGGFIPPGGYSVAGTSSLYMNKNAEIILRFGDDFQTQSGPGLNVYLSNTTSQVNLNGVSLGELPKTSGGFEINVSKVVPNVTLSTFSKVIVHCKPFDIPFGVAELD